MATGSRRRGTMEPPTRSNPYGRLRIYEPDWPLHVPDVRLQQQIRGDHPPVHDGVRIGRSSAPNYMLARALAGPNQSTGGRPTDACPRRDEELTHERHG